MARPELRIMSRAPRATPLRICARFMSGRLLLAGRVGGRMRLVARGFGDDLPAEPVALLDDLADVARAHELVVGVHLHLSDDAVEAQAVERRLDLGRVD